MNIKTIGINTFNLITNKLFYWGLKYKCPFCNSNLREFKLMGEKFSVLKEKKIIGGGERKACCPNCNSIDRERMIWLYLNNYSTIIQNNNAKVLHIAPERNLVNYFKSKKEIEYTCGDKFTKGYSYPEFVQNVDVTNLKFETNQFDMVLCNHVLEHIIDDNKAMAEIYRVLKPGGEATLQVPYSLVLQKTEEDFSITSPTERENLYGQFDHVRLYGQDYSKRLEDVGFKVSRLSLAKKDKANLKYGINELEDLFIANK